MATGVPAVNPIVALTGGIGAGKSTVASLLAERGMAVIDVDALGRAVIAPGGSAVDEVVARFGDEVRGGDGGVDRARLASIVFNDREALAALEAISHPAINRALDTRLDEVAPGTTVVFDMAILVGSRLGRDLPSGRSYGTVVVVESPEALRVARLVEQRGMTELDARARIASQPSDADRRAVADVVVVNDGDLDTLRARVDDLYELLAGRTGLTST